MVEVTQEDKRCADLMYLAVNDMKRRREIAARHRIASTASLQAELAEARAEVERLMQERDNLAGIVQGWHYLAVGPDEMGDYYTHKQLVKLSEPYASPALHALAGKETP
jgi:hypothetical protein